MNRSEWSAVLDSYEGGNAKRSIGQFIFTVSAYFSLMIVMFYLVYTGYPYWIALLVAIPAAGFHVKIFIILHDCSHNSYFHSQKACTAVGRICGLITFTPYYDWRRSHAIHHASVANLEKRGVGDVWTMTVEEYKSAGRFKKLIYRIFRNPLFLFGIAPAVLFLLISRFPRKNLTKKEFRSIILTDLVLASVITTLSLFTGLGVILKSILPIVILSSMWGVWLFYVQHQFKNVYWSHSTEWDYEKAALLGCSFYKMPGVLRWFSGNIGYHHIHHLNSRIPNYNLKKCYNEVPGVRNIKVMTLLGSVRSAFLQLWDESSGKMVSFRRLKNQSVSQFPSV
ncbi:fatty acid desaturase [Oceanispirochaeta sp.]|jgi:omega-6 fatty acid desaturase (delta-12 desaturase)|uniref:fatty acid desaturase n=1 Tax=Oceanispirochaeta sp. TaxID=2035350 RepID=UPI00261E0141|nr:fatty acid desaturase [Oceanispirochaeta sp.]MDA3957037.1 fatty acid desaturase [Oceanispirochaeta sp.]